ncbi:hypothetical protein VTP01DRAFT_3662 [Rhizomucor pusillus]|uniref:uncharacterized protein n=1 Tax=Rhizomucor pusillus TaxID=4840 RepID=UPI0037431978
MNLQGFADWAKSRWNLKVAPHKSTISKFVKKNQKSYYNLTNSWKTQARQKTCPSGQYHYGSKMLKITAFPQHGINRSGCESASEKLKLPGDALKWSNGWKHLFRKRHKLKRHSLHGESRTSDIQDANDFIYSVQDMLSQYALRDIYNMDETALLYSSVPRSAISKSAFAGFKDDKSKLTVALTYNADGSDQWRPLIVGFSLYYYNEDAWMTQSIFKSYLKRFDSIMRSQGRHVLLLLDNFSGHKCDYEPTNVCLCYLPPNTTSIVQPLDAGIIKNLKCFYNETASASHIIDLDPAEEREAVHPYLTNEQIVEVIEEEEERQLSNQHAEEHQNDLQDDHFKPSFTVQEKLTHVSSILSFVDEEPHVTLLL